MMAGARRLVLALAAGLLLAPAAVSAAPEVSTSAKADRETDKKVKPQKRKKVRKRQEAPAATEDAAQKTPGKRRVKRYHMSLFNVNTKERLDNLWVIRVDDKDKNKQWVGDKALRTLTRFMRDWRTEKTKAIPKRLLWHLYIVGYHFDAPLEIVSAYRHNERKSSRHKKGEAIDFRIEGVDPKVIWEFCKRFDNVGLGYYPKSGFVHIDVRDKSYYWIDDSGPGQKSRYRSTVAQRGKKKARPKAGKKKK
ncbi:MAG: YcbK family protein [Myxococcales bacterium]|nr:YcbK family protein [Myxococcales bacterium]MCB9550323.1 YcbK family protein [Myxococcales bacterium]